MIRDVTKLADTVFDILVIGGGIYGAAIAREAAYQGLSVALVEKTDFAHAASANSLKIIHGGLRYLQNADLVRMRRSITARRTLLQIAPHLVKPLQFVVPTMDTIGRDRTAFWLALRVNDLISWDRNRNLEATQRIPNGAVLSRGEFQKLAPGFKSDRFTGGATWYDAIATNTERLVLELVMAATEKGACAANYVKAEGLNISNGKVLGVAAIDQLSHQTINIRAKITVNAAGPGLNHVIGQSVAMPPIRLNLTKAVNVFVKRNFFKANAVGFYGGNAPRPKGAKRSSSNRLFFCVPWREGSMIGTTYKAQTRPSRDLRATGEDLRELIGRFNYQWPDARVTSEDVGFCHVGLVPTGIGDMRSGGETRFLNRSIVIDHRTRDGIRGLISIAGEKYTTAIIEAQRLVTHIGKRLNRPIRREALESPLPGGKKRMTKRELRPELSENYGDDYYSEPINRFMQDYGALASRIVAMAADHPARLQPICEDTQLTEAEVVYFVREEMAQKPADVLLRRTNVGWSGGCSLRLIERCVELIGQELAWDDEKKLSEVRDAVGAFENLKKRQHLASHF
jgi:glycerol-3-phosphate dehydrogenase